MDFKIFGTSQKKFDLKDLTGELYCFKFVLDQLDMDIESYVSIEITKNEITVVVTASEHTPIGAMNAEEYAYYFNISDLSFNNGSDEFDVGIDWEDVRDFYFKYAEIEHNFINAIQHKDIKLIKELNQQFPERAKPSINECFYANYFIMMHDINILEWTIKIDNAMVYNNKKYSNSVRIAIESKFEEGALWLLENYTNIELHENYKPFYNIELAKAYNMDRLINKMIQNEDFLKLLINSNKTEFIPQTVTDLFLF